eukprot:scaffold16677_cov14-Prasinocladus_malaysianus.AAC.1
MTARNGLQFAYIDAFSHTVQSDCVYHTQQSTPSGKRMVVVLDGMRKLDRNNKWHSPDQSKYWCLGFADNRENSRAKVKSSLVELR